MKVLVTLLIAALLQGTVAPAATCATVECDCEARACCTPTSGCCDRANPANDETANDGCRCSGEGCDECAGCSAGDERVLVVETKRVETTAPATAAALALDVPLRRPREVVPSNDVPSGPRRHVWHCVWLT